MKRSRSQTAAETRKRGGRLLQTIVVLLFCAASIAMPGAGICFLEQVETVSVPGESGESSREIELADAVLGERPRRQFLTLASLDVVPNVLSVTGEFYPPSTASHGRMLDIRSTPMRR